MLIFVAVMLALVVVEVGAFHLVQMNSIGALARTRDQEFHLVMSKLDDVLALIDTESNDIGAGLDTTASAIADLRAQLANVITPAQSAHMDAITANLSALATRAKSLAADPNNPVPVPTPAPVTPPVTPPAS